MKHHKERHELGGMYVEPTKLLTLVHMGLAAAAFHKRDDLLNLSESLLSGLTLVLRNEVGYVPEELGNRIELLEKELEKLKKKRLKSA